MDRDIKKFDNLMIDNVPMVMLESREDKCNHHDKITDLDRKKYLPVVVPNIPGGFKEKYCNEY